MTKKELIDVVAEKTGTTKVSAKETVDTVFAAIAETLVNGETVDLSGYGKFTVKERAARKGVNPATKETIEIPASKVVSFKVAKALKESVK